MKKVIITVEINSVEGWSVNWDDEKEAKCELDLLNQQVKDVIASGIYIASSSITVKSVLEK